MSSIRQASARRSCSLRLEACAADQCCFAHYRRAEWAGTSIKPSDLIGADACTPCHDLVDRRTKLVCGRYMTQDEVDAAFGRAMARTLDLNERAGLIVVVEDGAAPAAPVRRRKSKGRTASPAKCLPRAAA